MRLMMLFLLAAVLTSCTIDTIRNDPHPRWKAYRIIVP